MSKYHSDWVSRNLFLREEVGEHEGKPILHFKQYERAVIVCLCGSTRFKEAFEAEQRTETLEGRIVLTVGMFGHVEGIDMSGPVKQALDRLHLEKIYLADEVLVLNVGGYVGSSTRNEVLQARRLGKTVRWLEPDNVPPDLAG